MDSPFDRIPSTPLRCAAIDVGSHSVKLTIAGASTAGWQPRREQVVVTGLGRGEPRREGLDRDARRLTLEALAGFAADLREHAVSAVAVAGTAVLRHAPDAADFAAEVRARTGLELEIISGTEEARLTYLGAVASLPAPDRGDDQIVFDIGGASTEVAWGRELTPVDRRSLDIGTIELARRFGLHDRAAAARVTAAADEVAGALAALPGVCDPARLVAIGATPATLLALDLGRDVADSDEVHGEPLPRGVIAVQTERLRLLSEAERRALPGLHPGRAVVVLAGAVICGALAARWPTAPLVLSNRGLRAGLMLDRFGDGR